MSTYLVAIVLSEFDYYPTYTKSNVTVSCRLLHMLLILENHTVPHLGTSFAHRLRAHGRHTGD